MLEYSICRGTITIVVGLYCNIIYTFLVHFNTYTHMRYCRHALIGVTIDNNTHPPLNCPHTVTSTGPGTIMAMAASYHC